MLNGALKRWLKLVVLMYLILALIGSFAISTGETYYFVKLNKDSLNSISFFSSMSHVIDWLAEDTTIDKLRQSLFSQLQNSLFLLFVLAGIINVSMYLVKLNLKIINKKNIPIIKNLILLKLLI